MILMKITPKPEAHHFGFFFALYRTIKVNKKDFGKTHQFPTSKTS